MGAVIFWMEFAVLFHAAFFPSIRRLTFFLLYILCLIAVEISLCYAHTMKKKKELSRKQKNLKKEEWERQREKLTQNIIRELCSSNCRCTHSYNKSATAPSLSIILCECVMDKIYLNDENGVPIPVKATTTTARKNIYKDEPYSNGKKTREMSCGYSIRYKLKHIVISNNIFSTLYSIFIVFTLVVFFARVLFFACSLSLFSIHRWLFGDFAIYVFMRMLALCCWLFDLDSWHWRCLRHMHIPRCETVFGWSSCGYLSHWNNEKRFPFRVCEQVECLVGFFFWGKLNKLCVDSGLCRCVSRKKNAVLWFKTKANEKETPTKIVQENIYLWVAIFRYVTFLNGEQCKL